MAINNQNANGENENFHRSIQLKSFPNFEMEDDFIIFKERLENAFEVMQIPENRKSGILIAVLGPKIYKILKNLCNPILPNTKPYADLITLLSGQFVPKMLAYRERKNFYDAKQIPGESITDWHLRIKSLAVDCEFGANLNNIIKDRFICGLQKGKIFDRICEEDLNVSYEDILKIALSKEIIEHNQSSVNKLQSTFKNIKSNPKKSNNQNLNLCKLICFACGKPDHNFSNCKFKKLRCNFCNSVGHISSVCKKKNHDSKHFSKNTSVNDVKTIYTENIVTGNNGNLDQSHTNDNIVLTDLYHFDICEEKPILINVKIEGVSIIMEIDTGSGKSIISYQTYLQHFSQFHLIKDNLRMKPYIGASVEPVGYIDVNVIVENNEFFGRLYVIQNGNRPLLGRSWLTKLNIKIGFLENDSISMNVFDNDIQLDKDVQLIIDNYKELFTEGLGTYQYGKINIKVKPGTTPIFRKPIPIPYAFKEKIENQLDQWESEGSIERVDTSDWGTPLTPVLNKKGFRLCANYKITVNKYLEDFNHPLPRIEDLFAALHNGKEFTKLDLTRAYNQLLLDDETSMLLALSTHRGIYKVNRLTFGTKNACNIFQLVIEKVLMGCKGTIVLMDDILVTGKNRKEHLQNLKIVLDKLMAAGFHLNKKKCKFFQNSVKYMGHIIDKNGLHKDFEKISALVDLPRPHDITSLKGFIGLANYYAKFTKNISTILNPLYNLLKKDIKFDWTSQCEDTFNKIKDIMIQEVNLTHFDPSRDLFLVCDASSIGVGAVLLQKEENNLLKPISFASRILSSSEKNYSMLDKEALAIYFGVKKFSQYLLGKKFKLFSDHKPLTNIFGSKCGIPTMAAGRLQRWAIFLSNYDFDIEYIKGVNNQADIFSRCPLPTDIFEEELSYINFFNTNNTSLVDFNFIKDETLKDEHISRIIKFCLVGWPNKIESDDLIFFKKRHELTIEEGILMWGYRVVVPSICRAKILLDMHSDHMGIVKLKHLVRSYVWWPKIDSDIEQLINNCTVCLLNRNLPNKVEPKAWITCSEPFSRIHIDYADFEGKDLFIIKDAFTKWIEVFEMKTTNSFNTITILRSIFARFSIPDLLVSDNGPQFISNEFADFCKKNNIKHSTSAPYYPESNGAAENAVKVVKYGLRKMLSDQKNVGIPFDTILQRFLYSYRTSVNSVTGKSPFEMLFHRKAKLRWDNIRPSKQIQEFEKESINEKNNSKFFEIDDVVLARDYRNNKTKWKKGRIHEKIGSQMYFVKICDDNSVWKRHVNQLIKISNVNDQDEIIPEGNSSKIVKEKFGEILNLNSNILPSVDNITRQESVIFNSNNSNTPNLRRSLRIVRPPDRLNL